MSKLSIVRTESKGYSVMGLGYPKLTEEHPGAFG